MTIISDILCNRPRLEAALSALDKSRLELPILNPRLLFEHFDTLPVILNEVPLGPWSTPITDVVMIAKIALCIQPRRVLEVGCYRGYTTKLLAGIHRQPLGLSHSIGIPDMAKLTLEARLLRRSNGAWAK